ncbi:MAG TPA: cold shock domain-containing protein [Phycisphaerae bacterium]|nr:cold shock domain-containing protein [Phycisphaerae bacterium]
MSKNLGRVKWFNDRKGFGFITIEGETQDIFVHHTAIVSDGFRSLKEGELVEFEAEHGPKGIKAVSVRRMEAPAPMSGAKAKLLKADPA